MLEIDPQLKQDVPLEPVRVTAEDIKAFAEALGDLNPLYLDAQAARRAGDAYFIGVDVIRIVF